MKNKRLLYVLIPLVLFVWGLIFYKIYKGADSDDDAPIITTARKHKSNNDKTPDTIMIIADYRDPFLTGNKLPERNAENEEEDLYTEKRAFVTKKESNIDMVIPDLKYFGVITNYKNKKKVGLFRLNNKDFILKEGDLQEEFRIINLFNDSVKISYRTVKKTIKKYNNLLKI